MAKPIKRDSFEAIEASAWGAGKGAVGGALLAGAVAFAAGAAFFGGIPALVLAGIGATTGTVTGFAGAGAALASAGGILGVLAVAGGIASTTAATAGIGIVSGIGALLGLSRTASRVGKENTQYHSMAHERVGGHEADVANAYNQGAMMAQQTMAQNQEQVAQQAYQAGAESVMQQLNQYAEKEAGHGHDHGHSHDHDHKHHGKHTKMVTERREQQALQENGLG